MILNKTPFTALKTLFIAFFIILVSGSASLAQSVPIKTDKDSLSVGDVFRLTIKPNYIGEYTEIIIPDSSSFPPTLEWIGNDIIRPNQKIDSITYSLQFFATTDVTLPPFAITYITGFDSLTQYTSPLTLFYKRTLPEDDSEFKPMKPIFNFHKSLWAWAIVIVAILLALFFLFRTLKNRKPEPEPEKIAPPAPFQNPIEELEKTLTALRSDYNLSETKDFKYFYSSMSDALRNYFEKVYNIPALESTSRELLRFLDAFGVDNEMIDSTRKTVNRADMVKFAKFTPTLDDAWKSYQICITFLERAKLVDAARIERKRTNYEISIQNPETKTEEAI